MLYLVWQNKIEKNCIYNAPILWNSSLLARLYEVQKSYCSQPGFGVGVGVHVRVGVAFQVKVFRSLYLLKVMMDLVDTLLVVRYWSEVLFSTIMAHLHDHGEI